MESRKKSVTWDPKITGGEYARPCACQSCYVCAHNRYTCDRFGKYVCEQCHEPRCGMCVNLRTHTCHYCRRHFALPQNKMNIQPHNFIFL